MTTDRLRGRVTAAALCVVTTLGAAFTCAGLAHADGPPPFDPAFAAAWNQADKDWRTGHFGSAYAEIQPLIARGSNLSDPTQRAFFLREQYRISCLADQTAGLRDVDAALDSAVRAAPGNTLTPLMEDYGDFGFVDIQLDSLHTTNSETIFNPPNDYVLPTGGWVDHNGNGRLDDAPVSALDTVPPGGVYVAPSAHASGGHSNAEEGPDLNGNRSYQACHEGLPQRVVATRRTAKGIRVGSDGMLHIGLRCISTFVPCGGTLTVRALVPGRRPLVVGRSRYPADRSYFAAVWGDTQTVAVLLSDPGCRLLRRARHFRARVALTADHQFDRPHADAPVRHDQPVMTQLVTVRYAGVTC